MGNLFYEQLQKQSEPDEGHKIKLEDIAKICKDFEACSNKCPFYDDEINVGACFFEYEPSRWDIKRIIEGIERR